MSRARFVILFVSTYLCVALGWSFFDAAGQDQEIRDCSICHGRQDYKRYPSRTGMERNLFVNEVMLARSVHHDRECVDCHADVTTIPHENYTPKPVNCARCHYLGNLVGAPQSEAYQAYQESIHGEAVAAGKPNAPRCQDCHGTHNVQPPPAPDSPVSHFRQAGSCGRCHEKEYQDYGESVHGKSVLLKRSEEAPSCTNCHGEHDIFAGSDPRSAVYPTKVSQDCARCHEAMEIVGSYGVETHRLKTYRKSFHGIATGYGSIVAANCASCHGNHLVLHSSDPKSSVNPDNIPRTCGQEGCHPGAGSNFAAGKIHIDPESEESGLVYWISLFFRYFTLTIILGLVAYIALDLGRRFFGSRRGAEKKT
jgi:hypothetical protein